MSKLAVVCAAVLAGIVGCGEERANSSPPESPPGVDFKYNAAEESDSSEAEAKKDESEPKKAEPEKAEAEASKSQHGSDREVRAAPEACKGFSQKKCEISVGCAWSTDKKCVPQ